jgi:Cft2 family RNA processing exonuclease
LRPTNYELRPTLLSVNEEISCLPYAVGHESEGVCLLVKMGPYRVLLDCGTGELPQLEDDIAKPWDLAIVSSAHPARSRGCLALHRTYPQLPIYASDITSQLLPLNWLSETAPIPQFCQALPWQREIEFQDGLTAELFPAGNLPGAAAVLLTYAGAERTYRLFYSGDFFLSNCRLVEGLHLDRLRHLHPDVAIVAGTNGTVRHPHRRQQENDLMARFDRSLAAGNSIVLPVPTIGTAQELLLLLRSHHLFTGKDVDIWIDGDIAAGCDAYLEILPSFPPTVQNFARHQSLFWDEKVRPHARKLTALEQIDRRPCIILTDENGDYDRFTGDPDNPAILCVPLQSAIAYERRWSENIETYLLSDRADGLGTTQLIHNLRPKHVMFVAGNINYLNDLTALEELQNRYHLHVPNAGTLVPFPIGDTFIQPAPPIDPHYEGELTELATAIDILLPSGIADDPRWENFADTGIIEARWQGEEIVLRSISQRELLDRTRDRPIDASQRACANCAYQRGSRCYNESSPLHNFKVPADGYCPSFEYI